MQKERKNYFTWGHSIVIMIFIVANMLFASSTGICNEPTLLSDETYVSEGTVKPIPAIEFLKEKGILKGDNNGELRLEDTIIRSELITMVCRSMDWQPLDTDVSMFNDVSQHWAKGYIEKAAFEGIIIGYEDNTFKPDNNIKYEEIIKIIVALDGNEDMAINMGGYPHGYMIVAAQSGLTKGASGIGTTDATREQVCTLLYNFLNKTTLGDELVTFERTGFTWDLNNLMPKDKNYMFSPFSVKMALAIAAVGSDGETKDEILKTLGIEDIEGFNKYAKYIILEYSQNEDVKLNVANSLWLNTDYYENVEFASLFKDTVSDFYNADSEEVNNENAVENVNDWVESKTNGKITELISDSDFLACILNTIYFKGEWTFQFKEKDTKKSEFTDRNDNKTEIDFMNMTGNFQYYEDSGIQMIKLPYRDKKTSMYITICSDREVDLDKKIEKMDGKRVQVSIPKFKTEFYIELNSILSELGIKTAFNSNEADFKRMFTETPENIFISKVIHKTFIDVDENGTEAAAATAIFMAGGMPTGEPIVFNANKPFTYFIRDDVNDEILFIGEYAYVD